MIEKSIVTLSLSNISDPPGLDRLYDYLMSVKRPDGMDDPMRARLRGQAGHQGVLEVISICIAGTDLVLTLVNMVLDWQKAQKQERQRRYDVQIETADWVIEIRARPDNPKET